MSSGHGVGELWHQRNEQVGHLYVSWDALYSQCSIRTCRIFIHPGKSCSDLRYGKPVLPLEPS